MKLKMDSRGKVEEDEGKRAGKGHCIQIKNSNEINYSSYIKHIWYLTVDKVNMM